MKQLIHWIIIVGGLVLGMLLYFAYFSGYFNQTVTQANSPAEKPVDLVELRLNYLEVDLKKLSQNDSTLAVVMNSLHRRIKALEADTAKGKK